MGNEIIGFGTFPLKEELLQLIPEAEKQGYTIVDTSDDYHNEVFVSKAVSGKKIKIITKFSYVDNVLNFDDYFKKQQKVFEENGNKINCYLMHWPYPHLYRKIWRKMEDLYLQGDVSEIGVCNFTVRKLEKLLKDCRVKPMYNQIELHPLFQQKEITDFCLKNGIKIISYSPLARRDKDLFENKVIKDIAEKYDTSIINIILKWNIQKGFIPIPSTSKSAHLKEMSLENLEKFTLNESEIEQINGLECGKRIRFNPDTYFSTKTKIKLFLYSILLK